MIWLLIILNDAKVILRPFHKRNFEHGETFYESLRTL